jgi:hypothetical protein
MVDGQKPETLLETLNVTNQDFTLMITMPVSSASSEYKNRSCYRNIILLNMRIFV